MNFSKGSLTPGVIYEFKVLAYNIVGDGTKSSSIAIRAATLPGAPINLTKQSADENSLQFVWTEPTSTGSADITSYKIYWNNGLGSTILSTPIEETSNGLTLSYSIVSGLTTGAEYLFKVSAVNEIGEGP